MEVSRPCFRGPSQPHRVKFFPSSLWLPERWGSILVSLSGLAEPCHHHQHCGMGPITACWHLPSPQGAEPCVRSELSALALVALTVYGLEQSLLCSLMGRHTRGLQWNPWRGWGDGSRRHLPEVGPKRSGILLRSRMSQAMPSQSHHRLHLLPAAEEGC